MALYQRKKGRDLFDLAIALEKASVDPGRTVAAFSEYMSRDGHRVTRAQFERNVRKGEHGSLVVYANSITKNDMDADTGEETAQQIYFLKGYTVFNAEQIESLPAQYYALAEKPGDFLDRIEHAENFFAATGASITHGGNRAFYRPFTDQIVMPPFEAFRDAESYYATLAHEATHWTMHASRLDRDFSREYGGKRFGSQAYAIEELVAELGSAFLCADLRLALEPREDHAAYIANWLEVLKNDKHAIFTAASHAQRAADFINGLAAPGIAVAQEKEREAA